MNIKKAILKLYERNVVRKHWLYYSFILICVCFSLFLLFTTKVAVIEKFSGVAADDRIIVNEIVDYPIKTIYVYQNRSDMVVRYAVTDVEHVDQSYTVLFIEEVSENVRFEGTIYIDIENGYINLLDVVIGSEKRYVEKDLK